MKRMIIAVGLLLAVSGISYAQQGKQKPTKNNSAVAKEKTTITQSSKTSAVKAKAVEDEDTTKPVQLMDNTEYPAKSGQAATPEGHQATPVNGSGFAILNKGGANLDTSRVTAPAPKKPIVQDNTYDYPSRSTQLATPTGREATGVNDNKASKQKTTKPKTPVKK